MNWLGALSERRSWAYLLLAPSLILVLAVVVYPVASGIALSFHDFNLLRAAKGWQFVGVQQFLNLFQDDKFPTIVRNTFVWVIAGAVSQFAVGLGVALALNRKTLRGGRVARVLVLLPWIMPSVVAAHMWALLLDSRLGVINDIFVRLGLLSEYKAWFADPKTAMASVLIVDLWKSFPFFTLMLYAGLQTIPDDLYEAASVDGASPWQKFVNITLPLLAPVIVAVVILRVIGLVNAPDLMIVLTNGGPGLATYVLSLFAFQTAYENFNFGYAAAISVSMLVILMTFTVMYMRVSGVAKE